MPPTFAKPLQLDDLDIGLPVVQAALSGYSDWAMRRLARLFGASYTQCEVMLDQFLMALRERKKTRHFLHRTPDEFPLGAQLMGSEPEQFVAAAGKLVEAGFDVIDINFGCPAKKVVGRCRGGYLLSQPARALTIVRAIRNAVPDAIPVTVKMRSGMDHSEQSREQFYTILDGAFSAGVAAVTVHGRSVRQGYEGASDWGFLAEVKRHVGERTILGSGDLFSAEDCLKMLRVTCVDGVAVARGAIGNPWIFEQTRALLAGRPKPAPPDVAEQGRVMRMHFDLAEQLHGPERCGRLMRKFGIQYAALHPEHVQVREALVRVKNRDDWNRVLAQWYR